jgi:hypothetical protein
MERPGAKMTLEMAVAGVAELEGLAPMPFGNKSSTRQFLPCTFAGDL